MERDAYYDRIREAQENPDTVMSIIIDGMAQSHSKLPYLFNNTVAKQLQTHIQGLIDNSRRCSRLYQTYHNVTKPLLNNNIPPVQF